MTAPITWVTTRDLPPARLWTFEASQPEPSPATPPGALFCAAGRRFITVGVDGHITAQIMLRANGVRPPLLGDFIDAAVDFRILAPALADELHARITHRGTRR